MAAEPAAPSSRPSDPPIERADLTLLAGAAAAFLLVPGALALVGAPAPWAVGGHLVAVVLIVLSLHLVAGVARLPSLGQAGFAALGALVTVRATAGLGVPAPLALLAAGALLWLAGAVVAPALCRLPQAPFAGATLALGGLLALPPAADGPAAAAAALAAGPPLLGLPGYAAAAALALTALLAARRLTDGEVGAALLAAGDDPRAAAAAGIDAPPLRRRVFALGAALAGLGGGVLAQAVGMAAAATSLDVGASLLLFGVIVLGNPGSLTGALLVGVPYYLLAELAYRLGAADPRLPLAGLAALLGLVLWQRVRFFTLIRPPGFGGERAGKPGA